VPLDGDYICGVEVMIDGAADGTLTSASVHIAGGDPAVFDDAVANYSDRYVSVMRTIRANAIPAGSVLRVVYHKDSAAVAKFGHRLLSVRPVRVAAA
jgi:hypothetical protein